MVDSIQSLTQKWCVALYLMASLDDHKGPDDQIIFDQRSSHNGARELCSQKANIVILTWSKTKNPELAQRNWILSFKQSLLMYRGPSNNPFDKQRATQRHQGPDGGLEWRY